MSSNSQHSFEPQDLTDLIDERNVSGTNSNSDSAGLNQLNYFQLYLCAVVIGIFGGMVATAYYFVLEAMMHGMWHSLPEILKPLFPSWLPTNNY
ncbi:MAG: hypothetical protein AAFY63_14955, partial [Cyanobacteria bacterium J06643_13]